MSNPMHYDLKDLPGGIHCAECGLFVKRVWLRNCDNRPVCDPCVDRLGGFESKPVGDPAAVKALHEAIASSVTEGQRQAEAARDELHRMVVEVLDYQREAWETNDHINGANLVEFLGDWRRRAEAALVALATFGPDDTVYVVIDVSGGNVQEVTVSDPAVEVMLVDWDNIGAGDEIPEDYDFPVKVADAGQQAAMLEAWREEQADKDHNGGEPRDADPEV